MSEMTRDEMEARFAARDARSDAYEARNETKFQELRSDIQHLASEFRDFKTEVRGELREVRAEVRLDNRNTRATVILTLIASLLAFAGAMWTAQANLFAAFQAGLAKQQAAVYAPVPPAPERKAALADAR